MFSVPRSTREHHSFVKLGSLPSDFWASITPECRDCGKDVRGAATPDALAPLSAAPTVLSSLLTALSPPLCILADSSPLAPGTDPCISDPQGVLTLPTSFRITAQLPLPSLLSFLGGPVLPPPPPRPPADPTAHAPPCGTLQRDSASSCSCTPFPLASLPLHVLFPGEEQLALSPTTPTPQGSVEASVPPAKIAGPSRAFSPSCSTRASLWLPPPALCWDGSFAQWRGL